MSDCHYQKLDSLKSIWLHILDSVSFLWFGEPWLGWVRWGSIFYSWLGMSSIQHEIFIESIYNNQKLSILREYSITSCDHQTIFFMLLLPFYRSAQEALISDWSTNQDLSDAFSRSGPNFYILVSRILKNIFFNLGTRQNFFFYIRFSRQW